MLKDDRLEYGEPDITTDFILGIADLLSSQTITLVWIGLKRKHIPYLTLHFIMFAFFCITDTFVKFQMFVCVVQLQYCGQFD